jgi:TDG/mug DNA glycosylase family protein
VTVAPWSHLRLKDRIKPGVRVLFVGINPGVRSALTGHHFAGYSNRFWKLLSDSRLVPEPITCAQDDRLPEFGFGITNLIARPSPGIDDLRPVEYLEGWKILARKIRRYRPQVVALVGVTLYRAIVPLLVDHEGAPLQTPARQTSSAMKAQAAVEATPKGTRSGRAGVSRLPISCVLGLTPAVVHFHAGAHRMPFDCRSRHLEHRRKAGAGSPGGARVFVLPNPSGRNANFTYAQMLGAFEELGRESGREGG